MTLHAEKDQRTTGDIRRVSPAPNFSKFAEWCRPGSRRCVHHSAPRDGGSRPVREAPYRSRNGIKMVRSDKSTLCDIKLAARKATGGPGTGNPTRPRAVHFMITQCVLILRAREHRPRRRAPGRPHSANLEKMGARREEVCRFAGSTTPAARAAAWKSRRTFLDFSRVPFRVPVSPAVQSKDGF